jgi:protein-disulfide isomerase
LLNERRGQGLVSFADLGRRAGVMNMRQFEACVGSNAHVEAIEAGIRDAKRVGASGTPTLIVNGTLFRRGIDSTYIDALLARAERR